jgi:hypothetical protein
MGICGSDTITNLGEIESATDIDEMNYRCQRLGEYFVLFHREHYEHSRRS